MNSQSSPSHFDPTILGSYLRQYQNLKQIKKQIEERSDFLREKIISELALLEPDASKVSYQTETVKVELIQADRTNLDEFKASEILEEKGLDWCFKKVPDPLLVEQAYLQGNLSDSDLREMRNPQYSTVLRVTDV